MSDKEVDCGNCHLDPCSLNGDECNLFALIVEHFRELTTARDSEEYLQSSEQSMKEME